MCTSREHTRTKYIIHKKRKCGVCHTRDSERGISDGHNSDNEECQCSTCGAGTEIKTAFRRTQEQIAYIREYSERAEQLRRNALVNKTLYGGTKMVRSGGTEMVRGGGAEMVRSGDGRWREAAEERKRKKGLDTEDEDERAKRICKEALKNELNLERALKDAIAEEEEKQEDLEVFLDYKIKASKKSDNKTPKSLSSLHIMSQGKHENSLEVLRRSGEK